MSDSAAPRAGTLGLPREADGRVRTHAGMSVFYPLRTFHSIAACSLVIYRPNKPLPLRFFAKSASLDASPSAFASA